MPRVAVVTDSSAGLDPEVAARHGVLVVPLQVVVGGTAYADGVDAEASPGAVARALRQRVAVSTSRPSPEAVLDAYRQAADTGAEAVVSIHVSAAVSATHESARLAAAESPVPVRVVDSHQIGAGTGYAALAGALVAAAGGDVDAVVDAAARRAAVTSSLFTVDNLEHLRRGGRIGSAAALLGSALAVKPILEVARGKVVPREKVRTSARAVARMEELAVLAAASYDVEVTVNHLDEAAGAERLASHLVERLGDRLHGEVTVAEVPAVLGAHVGPGLLGVVVAPVLPVLHSPEAQAPEGD